MIPSRSWAIEPCSRAQGNGGLLPPLTTSQSEMEKRRGGAKQSISWVWVWDEREQWSPDTSVTLAEVSVSCRWKRIDPPVKAEHELWAYEANTTHDSCMHKGQGLCHFPNSSLSSSRTVQCLSKSDMQCSVWVICYVWYHLKCFIETGPVMCHMRDCCKWKNKE